MKMTVRKSVALLCLAGLLCFSQPAWAAPFPNKTKDVVQDGNNYLVKKEREAFAESLKQFPDKYKVVVVESTAPEAKSPDEYAKLLYDNYNLDDDTMMIVLDYNSQQLGVYPGETLQDKGAKMEMLHDKIISYYEPFRNQKNYLDGIKTFITEVNNEYDRIKTQGVSATTAAAGAESTSKAADASKTKSVMSDIPLWLYAVGLVFVALVVAFIYSYIRRRQVFIELDDTEDWKDELVDKIQQIEVDKPLRRSASKQDEWMVELANRKEHLLHVRIIDSEMMIMEAEEACDRFRFTKARGLIAECQETLEAIEAELGALKQDSVRMIAGNTELVAPVAERAQSAEPPAAETITQQAPQQTRKMPKTMQQAAPTTDSEAVQMPAIGKLFESVERKLTNLRLDYCLSFHELKVQLDQVEHMRTESEVAAAAGDEAAQIRMKMGQQQLQELAKTLETIPALVHKIEKELVEDLKQLEEGIVNASSDGFDLGASDLDAALLQVKTVLKEAKSALEEGHIEKATKLVGVFTISLEKTYERIEDSLVGKKEAAATGTAANTVEKQAEEVEIVQPSITEELDAAREELLGRTVAHDVQPFDQAEPQEPIVAAEPEPEPEWIKPQEHVYKQEPEQTIHVQKAAPERKETASKQVQEDEYELVIPKMGAGYAPQKAELVIQTEDDVLDELERINGVLLRIRQQLKRSYLPGIPDQLKYYFEQSVHNLGQITVTMERYKYSLEEVTVLLNDANELLAETELLAERTISTCQSAEGAIQYTNRYRRQNRQVNELLTKAEQAFRQLEFADALRLAEEARLIVEGGEPQTAESRWLLRKKKKGLGHDTR
ncbi:UNVERIFIED_CONTAM: septation ring formation regulator [Brevibacillus sp. OAP136]